jgi:hypothetical protein
VFANATPVARGESRSKSGGGAGVRAHAARASTSGARRRIEVTTGEREIPACAGMTTEVIVIPAQAGISLRPVVRVRQ